MVERKIWIIGAGGFAFDIACKFAKVPGAGNIFMGFIDSREDERIKTKKICEQIGLPAMFEDPKNFDFADPMNRYMFGVGDAQFKRQFALKHQINPELFHRFEMEININQYAKTGQSIYWGCRIASLASVGYASFIDANSVLGHGTSVGNYCHIAVGVIIGGDVSVGDGTYIHSGAIIGNKVTIGENCIIGVGAVVVRDLPDGSKIIAPKSARIA